MNYIFTSKRLQFRIWKESDLDAFAAMNSNKEVMQFYVNPYNVEVSKNLLMNLKQLFEKKGYTMFCVELKESNEFAGFVGIMDATFQTEPAIEIGWRLLPEFWNKGLATEGAKRCLKYAFEELSIEKIYAVTSIPNKPSERVMQKIGMKKVGEFMHPKIEEEHPLALHVKYLITANDFK